MCKSLSPSQQTFFFNLMDSMFYIIHRKISIWIGHKKSVVCIVGRYIQQYNVENKKECQKSSLKRKENNLWNRWPPKVCVFCYEFKLLHERVPQCVHGQQKLNLHSWDILQGLILEKDKQKCVSLKLYKDHFNKLTRQPS